MAYKLSQPIISLITLIQRNNRYRSSESARRTYLSTLQKYHENNRELKLRDEQARYFLNLRQGMEERMRLMGTRIKGTRMESEPMSHDHMNVEEEL